MQKLSMTQQIGNFISTLLLGQTKEIIVRTEERLNHVIKTVDAMKIQLDGMDKRQSAMEVQLGKLDLRLTQLEKHAL